MKNLFKTTFKIFLGIFLAILMSGNVLGQAIITLTAGDVWGDGSGYQMLLDADATAYGSTIPTSGGLTTSGNASNDTYAQFEYKIPVNADGLLSTSNIVFNGSMTIEIPAGTYDWCITNPTPGDRMWIASSNGNINGRYDNFTFENGKTYEFVVTLGGSKDRVDLVTSYIPQWTRCYDFENNIISVRFENDNIYPWTIINNAPNNNTYCLKSGNDGVHNSVSSIKIEVDYENSGAISFDAGIYGEGSSDTYDWDKCRFYIDDELQFDYGAHARWENFEYEVTSGTHTFKWTYKKDGSVHPTGDAFFIDNICFDADMFLPISLLSFTATPQPEYNLIQWTTATEKNNELFILERSEDAVVFDEVYNVSGAGSSLEPLNYEFRDYYPVPDITYYRLTQVDYDGSKTTSEIVSCIRTSEKMSNWEYFTRYDNLLQVHSNDKALDIICSDLLGRTIWQGKIPPHDDTELDLKKPYMVHIYEDDVLVGSEKVFR